MMHVLLAASASARPGPHRQLLLALLPVVVLALAFDVYCIVDVIRSASVRRLPKAVWVIIILVISAPWGGLAYLFFGRDRRQRTMAPR